MHYTMGLKIDVRTWHGTREGVPQLIELLKKYQANASFFWTLGKDQTGRGVRRIFRSGFWKNRSKVSLLDYYDIKSLFYGTLLPGPDIGKREQLTMKQARDAGFDMGIYALNSVAWRDFAMGWDEKTTYQTLQKACRRFEEIFEMPAKLHGASAWQMNWNAYRSEQRLGVEYAADCRGECPFIPVYRGQIVLVPQFPTTLPTLDELIGREGIHAENVHDYLLNLTKTPNPTGHIFTLSAELEGRKLISVFEKLLDGWQKQGYSFLSLKNIAEQTDLAQLPHYEVEMKAIKGRAELVATQTQKLF